MLQGTIGNQAALRYLTQRLSNLSAKGPGEHHLPKVARVAGEAPSTAWHFSKIRVFPPDHANRPQARSSLSAPPLPGVIQPKLAVGRVNDPLEHEADRIADQVMLFAMRRRKSIPKYWEFTEGIYFKVFDREFLHNHRGQLLRFSHDGVEFRHRP
jgi:hypothetical protein